jgi:DNA-binding NtrC family response regulator
VLLIEDEDAVRKLAARILRRQGYAILEANRAEDAMQWLADERRTIDLLLTDVVLPGISGKEIAARAKSLRPDLPVLFMSGYAMSRLTERGLARPDMDLLEKPFTASSLAWRVRDVLDAHRVDGSAAAG